MKEIMKVLPRNLSTAYSPVAIYYEEADSVEYVRKDVPCVYRRVDGALTLVYEMADRKEPISFRLKGFKNIYFRNVRPIDEFVHLVSVLEQAFTILGDDVFERREAYKKAKNIAVDDRVQLRNLPKAAAI